MTALSIFFASEKDLYISADDNTLLSIAKSVTLLAETLMAESQNAMKWFSENKMMINPENFKLIVIQKGSQTIKSKQFFIENDVAVG